jgi:hypothetical protein
MDAGTFEIIRVWGCLRRGRGGIEGMDGEYDGMWCIALGRFFGAQK